MLNKTSVMKISDKLNLTPYQAYVLEQNGDKYELDRLVKRGMVLYAPYRCISRKGFWDKLKKLFLGSRADLIGADRILVKDERGIRLFATGFFTARDTHGKYYADSSGMRISRNVFYRIIH
jgi:hypothetical protein